MGRERETFRLDSEILHVGEFGKQLQNRHRMEGHTRQDQCSEGGDIGSYVEYATDRKRRRGVLPCL